MSLLYRNPYGLPLPRLNPAQHRLLQRHLDRAVEALSEADRLLRGAAGDLLHNLISQLKAAMTEFERGESNTVRFKLAELPARLIPYLENPFAQALAFNLHCERTGQSHTQGAKDWPGGAAAVAGRNLVFLPPVYGQLWEEGLLDKTRLVAIANRNLTAKGYEEVADLVRTRRREDVDERLLKMPPGSLHVGRRGPGEAMVAARANGWVDRLASVDIPGELVVEAGSSVPDDASPPAGAATPAGASNNVAAGALANKGSSSSASTTVGWQSGPVPTPATTPTPPAPTGADSPVESAKKALRAGTSGAKLAPEVAEALSLSPDPMVLVERYLTAHRKSGDADPAEVTRTLFFAHAGPMTRLVADDKLLLRHFRPVKTQKRGQLFYRLLEVIEEALLERNDRPDLNARGITEQEAMVCVRKVIVELNKDPNRHLVIPDEWLGEVTRRHLYFGSRTRKEGAAYKWFRKIGPVFYLGAHKTQEEIEEKAARRAAKNVASEEEEEEITDD